MTLSKQEIKTEWINALESGEYEQGTGVLHDVEQGLYCCLGVLCEIAIKHGVIRRIDVLNGTAQIYGLNSDSSTEHLPLAVAQWAGLPDSNPEVTTQDEDDEGYTRTDSLAELNDGGHTFKDIAVLIREQL